MALSARAILIAGVLLSTPYYAAPPALAQQGGNGGITGFTILGIPTIGQVPVAISPTVARWTTPSFSATLVVGTTPITGGTNGNCLYINSGVLGSQSCSSATGTVTSVAMTVPTFLSVGGSPITGSGTLAVTLSGTALPVANGGTGATSAGATAANNIGALAIASNLSDLGSATTARMNLGLGSLAVLSSINNANWSGTALAVANGGTGATSAGAIAANNIGALAIASNLSDLNNAGTARTNLGLGTFATQNFATPPAIGGTTPAAGSFSSLTDTGITGSTQCVQASSAGLFSGTGSACGSGGSGTVNSGVVGQLAYYASNGTAVSGNALATMSGGALSLGSTASSAAGSINLAGLSSGGVTLQVGSTGSLWNLTLPTSGGTNLFFLQTNGSGVTTWAAAPGATFANPSASVGLTAVNGSATTAIRSDGAPALSQAIAPTWTAQHIFNEMTTVVSATGAALDDVKVGAATTTVTGTTTITALAKVGIYRPTITDASAVTVTDAASLYVDNSPLAAGSVTLTNAWAIRVGAGNVSFPGTGNALGTITSGTWNGTAVALNHGGTAASLTASNGGIVYSTASALAILSGTATANQCLLSGSNAAPSWGACGSTTFANPSASVGLSAVNGSATTAMRSDAAPALSQAIVPTWTGLHTFNDGMVLNNLPLSATFTGSGMAAFMAFNQTAAASSATVPELGGQFTMTSNTGLANHQTAYKIAFTSSIIAGSSSADIYGINNICQGFGGTYLVTCAEDDVNNVGAAATTLGASTSVYGHVVVGAGTAESTAAYWATAQSPGQWAYGYAISNASGSAVDIAGFADQSQSKSIMISASLHEQGINLFAASFSAGPGAAFISPNNVGFGSANAAGSALVPLIYLDTGNLIQFGSSAVARYSVNGNPGSGASYFNVIDSHGAAGDIILQLQGGASVATDTTSLYINMVNGANSIQRGNIAANDSAGTGHVAFNNASDARLKKSLGLLDDAVDRLMKIEVHRYQGANYTGDEVSVGFFAQNLYAAYPWCVTPSTDEDYHAHPWSVDYGCVTPLLTAVAQDHQREIENLNSRLKAIEQKIN